MPLFDALEHEVSSFFVAQGSIFDTILKTVLERLSHVESRVDASVHTVNKLALHVGHGTAAGSGGSNEELEYFVLTLARQLNLVLSLLFQPYAVDAAAKHHERLQHLPSISHVLTNNESILMDLQTGDKVEQSETRPTSDGAKVQTSNKVDQSQQQPTNDSAKAEQLNKPTGESSVAMESTHEQQNHQVADTVDAIRASNTTDPSAEVPILRQSVSSTYTMIHHLHAVEEERKYHEKELLERMQRLLHESKMACQAQCQALHDQNDALLRELQQQQQNQASTELLYAQLQDQQQKELDKQLLAFSNTFLASQTAQEQHIARILETLRDFGDRFVSRTDVDELGSNWLQTARDDCIYGADVETLTKLQLDLQDLQEQLQSETPSPALSRLQEEVAKVVEVVERGLEMLEDDNNALHGPTGSQLMQSLRHVVGPLEELAHDALEDAPTSRRSLAFLTDIARQMELGTASLLEAIERQQEGYQQALSHQQADLDLLKLELQAQKLSDEELQKQLMECPNQEDTMRLVNALREQLQASTSDSASRMLDTVDDLRSKMEGLPTHDFLEELLHSKADRSEIDRLRLLLAANPPPGGPSFAKSPTRCLSCDQTLPFMQSRPTSASYQPNDSERPLSAGTSSNPSRPGSHNTSTPSPSRQGPHGPSPTRKPLHHQSMVELPSSHAHTLDDEPHDHRQNQFVSPFTRAMFLVSEHGIPSTKDILRDLSASIESTKRRRQRVLDQQDQLAALDEERTFLSFAAGAPSSSSSNQRKSVVMLGTPEDRKNKFPLRRTTLSDQVVYGPSITSGFIKPRKSITSAGTAKVPGSARRESDDLETLRPKTAVTNDRRPTGGDLIMRAPSTTVVIRPFSEKGSREEASGRRNTRAI